MTTTTTADVFAAAAARLSAADVFAKANRGNYQAKAVVERAAAALAIGIVFSGLVGIVAGFYPAIRASRLSPVEALRSD